MHTFVPNPWPKPKFVLWNQWHQKCLHLPEKQNSNCSSHTHKDTYTECTCFLQSVYHFADTIHALLASGDLILEEKHFMIPISTHIHKSMNTCKTLLRHTAHHKKNKQTKKRNKHYAFMCTETHLCIGTPVLSVTVKIAWGENISYKLPGGWICTTLCKMAFLIWFDIVEQYVIY